jgi:hypothetical protein
MKAQESIASASSDAGLAWAVGAAAALLYLSQHSYFYNFDGVACAVAVELSDFKHLVHGNHLAYGVAGWAFWKLWTLLGYQGQAIIALQALNGLLGGAAAGVFFSALRRAGVRRPAALAAAAGLALSHGWWFWSLEAQVYPLGLLFAALFLREALAEKPSAWRLGAFQGAAILGHAGHAMLAPAAVYCLLRRGGGRRSLAAWLAGGAAVVLPAYALAGFLAVRPSSLDEVRLWLLGSAALNHERTFAWHGAYSAAGVKAWLVMWIRVVADHLWAVPHAAPAAWGLAAAVLSCAAAGAARAGSYTARFCGLWLAGYALLFLSWEPHTMVYRLSDLLPVWLLAAAALERSAPAAWTLAAGLGVFNGLSGILPRAAPESNPDYLRALALGETVPADAAVVVEGQDQVYVPYFARRRTINLYRWELRPDALAEELDARRARGEDVYVESRTLRAGDWRRWFENYGLEPAGEGLYRARRKGKPKGSTTNSPMRAPALKNGPNGIGSERLARPRASSATP